MALAEHNAVLILPSRCVGIDLGVLQVEYGQNLADGERTPGMAGVSVVNRLQYIPPKLIAKRLQLFAARFTYHGNLPFFPSGLVYRFTTLIGLPAR